MKKLRILTGRHVGASLDLAVGSHLLGPGSDCDITITDWTFAPLRLHVGREGDDGVMAEWTAGPAGEASADEVPPPQTQWRKLVDFEPREFDGTVVCVGPPRGRWPSDVALLDVVFKPTAGRVVQWAGATLRTRRVAAVSAAAVVVLSLLVSVVLAGGAKRPQGPAPTLESVRAALQRDLDRLVAGRLEVKIEPSGLVVTGLVDTSEQAAAVRAALQARRDQFPALPRFTLATDVAETIRGTVGLPNAAVRHVGNGVFTYVAEVADEPAARAAIERVSVDLAPTVKRIDATFERVEGKEAGPILSRFTADGISVVQTRDGVKHLVVKSSVSVQDALTLSRPPFNPPPGPSSANPPKE